MRASGSQSLLRSTLYSPHPLRRPPSEAAACRVRQRADGPGTRDEAVARGAAIQAAILNNVDSSVEDMLLLDITPLSLGLNSIGGITKVVVERNSLIPLQKTQDVATAANNQTVVCFEIVEGIFVYFLVLLVRLKLIFR